MLPFYSKYSIITRPTLSVSTIIIKLGGLGRWEMDGVELGAGRILLKIYRTQNGRPGPFPFASQTGAKYIFLPWRPHWWPDVLVKNAGDGALSSDALVWRIKTPNLCCSFERLQCQELRLSWIRGSALHSLSDTWLMASAEVTRENDLRGEIIQLRSISQY